MYEFSLPLPFYLTQTAAISQTYTIINFFGPEFTAISNKNFFLLLLSFWPSSSLLLLLLLLNVKATSEN